jgi:ADP-ribose pyrophosphatase YjhB (NUDIX family)
MSAQPIVRDVRGQRIFACFPTAVLACLVDPEERLLLLAHPQRKGEWEVVNGALEAGETIVEGVLREIREEIGAAVRVRPLGTVHVSSFYYDANCPYMISIAYLLAYEGGAIAPGGDMRSSTVRWMSRADIDAAAVKLIVPRDQKWVLHRAVDLYRLWKNDAVDLQPALDPTARSKYAL